MTAAMTEVDLAAIGKTTVVDARGAACPGPMIEAKKAISGIPVGEVMELWSGDPQTKEDMGYWTEMAGHVFLGAIPARGYERLFIRRGK